MSYAIYKTEAFILRIVPNGEANLDVVFLTRDLGKITVRVQSGRKAESKMRMHLVRYNHVVIDVVRGKSIWRLTGIHEVAQHALFSDKNYLHAWHRISGLAEHLIRGEDAHPELFDFLLGLARWIDACLPLEEGVDLAKPSGGSTADGLELFGVIHILEKLGYWHGESFPDVPTSEILATCASRKKELVEMINESIEATQIVV
jgi:hypothetical protein